MKKALSLAILLAMAVSLFSACSDGAPASTEPPVLPDFSSVDFESSPYKHLNNGGITDDDVLPYNVDAITGATLTVEGPAVVSSIPLSVRELENRNQGLVRGAYSDSSGLRIYEGLDLYYLLNEMVEGDNGIILTDKAYKVVLKNSNRATISEFTLSEVTRAHEDGCPILLAYGLGTPDGELTAPFVFDAADETQHSLGYIEALDNEDGCIRLVYDASEYGSNDYDTFSNVAYVYVCEETEPGFKHDSDGFDSSRYSDYIVTFRGEQLGWEADLTVAQLESLVGYDGDGNVVQGGLGYRRQYSLANTAYWYVNEYEGLDLYKLLMYLGMPSADEMGVKGARTTLISFVAADGVKSNETFSVDTLSYPDVFGFYNKNAADLGDGSYVSTNADLVDTGYPVLLAYGVNSYPYTVTKTDPHYLSGLANSGGPMRVVFGKTQYNHANGSNQVQYLSEVIVGDDVLCNTHKYTDNAAHKALADSEISFTVNSPDGVLADTVLTVGGIESVIYGENVDAQTKKAARIKDHYQWPENGGAFGQLGMSGIYEGIDLEYFLMNYMNLPGTNGAVTFSNGTEELTVALEELFREGYNTELGRDGVRSVIAFAKNGAPLVESTSDPGYVSSRELRPYLDFEAPQYIVENVGGPIAVLIPSDSSEESTARAISGVTGITVDLIPDSYAHISAPYDAYAGSTISFSGEGLDAERVYTVSELEGRQTTTKTLDFCIMGESGSVAEERYRGIPIYELFTEIGIKNNAGDVTVYSADGSSAVFSLSRLKREYENSLSPDKPAARAMLAYGSAPLENGIMDGQPLTDSDGGPLKLVVPQSADSDGVCVENVVAIEVSANEIDTWSHSMSDVYEEFLDDSFTLSIKNDENEWSHDFSVAQLESLKGIIVRDKYSVLDVGECEGLDIWKFIQLIAGDVEGIDDPISITAYASDGYKNDLFSVFYKDGFINGVADDNGDARKLILCYAINGYPLVDSESHEGYTGLAGNTAGPVRVIAETNQGASVKYCTKLVVTLSGSSPIDITVDESIFAQE